MEKLPQTSQAPLRGRCHPAAPAGGRRKAERDPGRMLSLWAIRPGNVSTPPADSAGHLSASLAAGRTERHSLSPCAPFGLFESPFLFQRGHTADLKEFVLPGSARQVCWCAHTLRENEWHLRVPHPGCSPHSTSPPLGAPTGRDEGSRKIPVAGGPGHGRRAAPTRGAVGGCYREVWIDSEKRNTEIKARAGRFKKRGKGAELTQAWALGAAVAVECGPETWSSSPGGRAASDFRGGGFCLLCRRRRSCGCRGS